ncbi:hypothetical protein NDU88_000927 [Pleurodeles waltl]|uniref:Lamina-associated polypeptide 2 alpha C-terminal domain-containing protein n=1 Tax=Pleurodeles waltl TaxID=8319 RepID=A0AAV7WGW2_PLEWA|nr:hypothetical protein NDU88_000927 [Pleurodeles waltl]
MSLEDLKGKYISNDMLSGLTHHLKENMGFLEDEVPETSSGSLLRQFQCSTLVDVPVHACIHKVNKRKWKDPYKITMPRFNAKLQPLQDMLKKLQDSIPVDSFAASLVGHTSLAEDAVIRDAVHKKVDVTLKKVYPGAHLALGAGIYGKYLAQSLISDLKFLHCALDKSSDCSGILELIECELEFLSDVTFDVGRASALSGGACVAARWNLVLHDWKTNAAQRSSALWMPFQGSVLFGTELEEKLNRIFKEKKHCSSLKSLPGD